MSSAYLAEEIATALENCNGKSDAYKAVYYEEIFRVLLAVATAQDKVGQQNNEKEVAKCDTQ